MSVPKSIRKNRSDLNEWVVLEGYRGSIAHGMYVPGKETIDDKDLMTIIVPPLEYYFGLNQYGSRGTKEIARDEWDIVVYEIRKFISLLEKGNPNVLSLLWLEPNYYTKITPAGQLILNRRHIFVGRHVYKSFSGYAYGQLHRMTRGNKMGYQGARRRQMFEKFGYDCKNAAHLVRLLRMGIEFLKDGELHVHRHDAQQLLEIKRGEWPLEKIEKESERLFSVAEQAFLNSTLPKRPDRDLVNQLSVDVVTTALDAGVSL